MNALNYNQINRIPNNQNQNLNINKDNNSNNTLMTQNESQLNNYEDIYPYIKDNKFRITFIAHKDECKKVLIPSSLKNSELYYTADKLNNTDFFEYSDEKFIELIYFYNNIRVIIPNDDNLIGYYINDDFEILIQQKNIISYQSDSMINILFKSKSKTEKSIIVPIPFKITVKNLIDAFFNKIKVSEQNQKYFSFFFNEKELKLNDNEIYNEGFRDGNSIFFEKKIIKNSYNYEYLKSNCPGKKISSFLKDKNGKLNAVIFAGTLQQIKTFYKEIKKYLSEQKIEFQGAPIIYYQNQTLELDEKNENTFSSYGINSDFICQIDVIKYS
jgi:hypothetical protein